MRLPYVLITMLAFAACGDPTDRPEDCNANEYFDDARNLCFVCPAPRATCDDGCGLRVTTDDRGCPDVECMLGSQCSMCGPTEFVDSSLRCTECSGPQTCESGDLVKRVDGDNCTLSCS